MEKGGEGLICAKPLEEKWLREKGYKPFSSKKSPKMKRLLFFGF